VLSRGRIVGVSWLGWFGVLGARIDLAGGDEQETDSGARECCRSGRRPMRKMVATIFFSGLFIFGLFFIHGFFSDFFWVFLSDF
jgi:hypothetical protein